MDPLPLSVRGVPLPYTVQVVLDVAFDTLASTATQSLALTVFAVLRVVTAGKVMLVSLVLGVGAVDAPYKCPVPKAVETVRVGAGGGLTVACSVIGVAAKALGATANSKLPSETSSAA
jgi:hypothetical protein